MYTTEIKNPIMRLLDLLPKHLAEQKRKAMDAELHEAGKYQHYRQCVRRENWHMNDTHVQCAVILIKHLGLSLGFFTATDEERDEEVDRLVKQAYQEVTVTA